MLVKRGRRVRCGACARGCGSATAALLDRLTCCKGGARSAALTESGAGVVVLGEG